jgi:hypothetical protein
VRLLLALAVASCGGPSPRPSLHFAGDPEGPATPSADVALTALVGGDIPVSAAWSACESHVPVLSKSDKPETTCARATSVLSVTCEPACATDRRSPEEIIVHPPGSGRLVVTATTVRDDNHEKLTESRVYDVVVPEDVGLICRDIHRNVQACDVPNDRDGTVEVVAYVHGKVIVRLGGVRIDGKDVSGGRMVQDVVDVHTPGPHTVELSAGGVTKKTVITVAPDRP